MEKEKNEKKKEKVKMEQGDFSKGSEVEVCIKNKGSSELGALWWYPATILEPPMTSTSKRRKTLASNKVLVQYKTLVSDIDPTKPLVENTSLSFLRPAPPPPEETTCFQQNDVVDAFYQDAWRPGVLLFISDVHHKYTVGFKNPPDFLELERNAIRSHWDWDQRRRLWTKTPKLVLRGSCFESGTAVDFGTAVEVNVNKDVHVWAPARYIGQLGLDSFLVQYKHNKTAADDDDVLVKLIVSGNQIRAVPPPCQREKDFHLRNGVDAFDGIGWRLGHITKVLTNKRYIVTFSSTKEAKEFSHSELRHHLDWTGKRWAGSFSDCDSNGFQSTYELDSSSTSVEKTPHNTNIKKQLPSPWKDKSSDGKTKQKLKISQDLNDDVAFASATPFRNIQGDHSDDSSSQPAKRSKIKGSFKDGEDNQQHNKDGETSPTTLMAKRPDLLVEHSKYVTNSEDSTEASVSEVQLAVTRIPGNEPDHDQLFIVEEHSVKTMEGSMNGRQLEIGVKGDMYHKTGPVLPFVKTLPFWGNIESMGVLEKFPQKPHFQPLLTTKEELREGSAFGKMLSFISLAEQTFKLQADAHKDDIDSKLEAAKELEQYGFDVAAIKHRLTELEGLKVKLEDLSNQSELVKTKIADNRRNKIEGNVTVCRLDEEIRELKANLTGLQQKRAIVVSMCEAEDSMIKRLQSEAEVINEDIESVRKNLNNLVAAPW